MAVPWAGYLLQFDAEEGAVDTAVWNGTNVDTQAKLNIRHYQTLVRKQRLEIPYRGAYCAELDLSLGTAAAYLESTAATATATTQLWFRWYVEVENLVMADNDAFSLLEVQSAGPVTEAMVGIKQLSGLQYFYASELHNSATFRSCSILPGYHCLELGLTIDAGGGNNGTLAFYVDGYQMGATIGSLDQGAIAQIRFGAQNIDAGTTSGIVLLDQLAVGITRIGPFTQRWPRRVTLTKSGHVAVGPGSYLDAFLLPGNGTDCHLEVYDTDEANSVADQSELSPSLSNTTAYVHNYFIPDRRDGEFERGLYVKLSGTTPRAYVTLGQALVTAGGIRNYAVKRRPHGPF